MALEYAPKRENVEPLWDRVDRNRAKLGVVVALFAVLGAAGAVAVAAAAVLARAVAAAFTAGDPAPLTSLPSLLGATGCLGALLALAYAAWALGRPEKRLLRRLNASLVPRGELLETKYALKDMAIAAGFPHSPQLYVIDTLNVNAFAVGRRPQSGFIGITRGFPERLTVDEQRAVFANLMARLRSGDTLWATGVSALMTPLWRWRNFGLLNDPLDPSGNENGRLLAGRPRGEARVPEQATASDRSGCILVVFLGYVVSIVISELLVFGHRRSQLLAGEVSDAEGMLLLKDPRSMLAALERGVECDNFVPSAGPGYSGLFWLWAGDGSTDDEDDLENARIARLREVLGAEGMAEAGPRSLRSERVAEGLLAPPAPRLEE